MSLKCLANRQNAVCLRIDQGLEPPQLICWPLLLRHVDFPTSTTDTMKTGYPAAIHSYRSDTILVSSKLVTGTD